MPESGSIRNQVKQRNDTINSPTQRSGAVDFLEIMALVQRNHFKHEQPRNCKEAAVRCFSTRAETQTCEERVDGSERGVRQLEPVKRSAADCPSISDGLKLAAFSARVSINHSVTPDRLFISRAPSGALYHCGSQRHRLGFNKAALSLFARHTQHARALLCNTYAGLHCAGECIL